jgi:hypothetical protein
MWEAGAGTFWASGAIDSPVSVEQLLADAGGSATA